MNYETLLNEADKTGVYVIENADFESHSDGLINGDVIGLNKNIDTTIQKACVLAEELGHYHTTVGNITDLSDANNSKQEYRARLWAHNHLVGLYGIVSCYKAGCHSLHEMAAHLEVSEEFMAEVLETYRGKYGERVKFDNYIIFFEPHLAVFEAIANA